jgi:hypothetical protein
MLGAPRRDPYIYFPFGVAVLAPASGGISQ